MVHEKKVLSLNFNPSAFPVGPFHGECSFHFTQRKFSTCNRLSSRGFNTLIEIIKLMSKGTDVTMVFKDFFTFREILVEKSHSKSPHTDNQLS